jgi:hypothetical protein
MRIVAPLIVFCVSVLSIMYLDYPYKIVSAILLGGYILYARFQSARTIIASDKPCELSLRKEPSRSRILFIGLFAALVTVQSFSDGDISVYFLPFFWMAFIGEIFFYRVIKQNNPGSILLSDTEIFLNDERPVLGHLNKLERIGLNISGSRIQFLFSQGQRISISERDYKWMDIVQLIERICEKAKSDVKIDEDIERRINCR